MHLTAHVRVVRESEGGQKGGRRLRGNTRNIPGNFLCEILGNFLCEILGNFLCEIPENFLCETSGERLRTSQSSAGLNEVDTHEKQRKSKCGLQKAVKRVVV